MTTNTAQENVYPATPVIAPANQSNTPNTNYTVTETETEKNLVFIEETISHMEELREKTRVSFKNTSAGKEAEHLELARNKYLAEEPTIKNSHLFLSFIANLPQIITYLETIDKKFATTLNSIKEDHDPTRPTHEKLSYFVNIAKATAIEARKTSTVKDKKIAFQILHLILTKFDEFEKEVAKGGIPNKKKCTDRIKKFKETHYANLKNYFEELHAWKEMLYMLLFKENELSDIKQHNLPKGTDPLTTQGISLIIKKQVFTEHDFERLSTTKTIEDTPEEEIYAKLADMSETIGKRYGDPSHAKILKEQLKTHNRKQIAFNTLLHIILDMSSLKALVGEEVNSLKELNNITRLILKNMINLLRSERTKFLDAINTRVSQLEKSHSKALAEISHAFKKDVAYLTEGKKQRKAGYTTLHVLENEREKILDKKYDIKKSRLKIDAALKKNSDILTKYQNKLPPEQFAEVIKKHDAYIKTMLPQIKWVGNIPNKIIELDKQISEIAHDGREIIGAINSEARRHACMAKRLNKKFKLGLSSPN